MSNIDEPDKIPTQPAMAAVRVPTTVEERVAAVEVRLTSVEARLSRVETRVDDGDKKHEALATDVAEIKTEMGTQTDKLDAHTTALADLKTASDDLKTASETRTLTLGRIEGYLKPLATQRVKDALTGLFLAAILAATAYLTSKGHTP